MAMRSRFRLWLKKRGGRRSGSQRTALAGELLYHGVFVGAGAIVLWLHVANALAPEWDRSAKTAAYEQATCRVLETRVSQQQGLSGTEFQPECKVQLLPQEANAPAGWASAGEAATSLPQAELALNAFAVGEDYECWRSPDNPAEVALVRSHRWWPWFATLIPTSLMLLGVVGIVRSVLWVGISPERRRNAAQGAGPWEALVTPTTPVAASALPDSAPVTDSPGVRLSYRLPPLDDPGWRLATLATICVSWNLLVAFFVAGIVIDIWTGAPQWALALAIAPLALGGVYMAAVLVREARTVTGIGATSVEVDDHPLHPGGAYRGVLIQSGQFKVRALSVSLVCEEVATYCQGTDTRTGVLEVYRQSFLRQPRSEVKPGKPFEREFAFEVPVQAMHSFKSAHNEVRWSIEARVTPLRWPAFRRRFLVCVYPYVEEQRPFPHSPRRAETT